MKPRAKPGFWLVATREWRWLFRDRVALFLIFGVPLFTFVVLTAAFSQPVIRGLGVVVVDADRSDTSRALIEQVAASPNLSIAARTGDLASAASAIRSGDAIAALYIPANFERDVKAERRPQVVGFYNQQYLTAAGIASAGLSASLSAAAASATAHAAPKPARIGSLVAETIVLTNPQTNYAQFLLRTLLPTIIHVVIALAGGYAVGSEFRRRSVRTWLACAGGNPGIALAGKLAPLFAIFFLIMLAVPLVLEGLLHIPFKGNVPMIIAAASLFIIAYLALAALLQLLVGDLPTGLGLTGLIASPAFGYAGVAFPALAMNAFAYGWSAILPLRWYLAVLLGQAAHGLPVAEFRPPLCRPRITRRGLRAAGTSATTRSRETLEPQNAGATAVASPRPAWHRRRFRRRMATRAGNPRCVYPADRRAADLRHLLPTALSQPDSAQATDRGR